jgi:hypothetical protein
MLSRQYLKKNVLKTKNSWLIVGFKKNKEKRKKVVASSLDQKQFF